MTRHLLWRGLLAGVIAAVCATLFARAFAEPHIDLAIAFETAHAAHGGADEPELVSRAVQKSLGLLTALALYGAALGGLFAIAFAVCLGRVGRLSGQSLALVLALAGFVVLGLAPALKYPPTPPAVGQHETVGLRTAAHFGMMALSFALACASAWVAVRLRPRLGALNAGAASVLAYVVVLCVGQAALPTINEVPTTFPATVLWDYRVASIGMQAVLWTVLGLTFGLMRDRGLGRPAVTAP
jgi:predicted cobalt transporter CbtA